METAKDESLCAIKVRKVRETDTEFGPEVGPAAAFSSRTPTGMHGPARIFWGRPKRLPRHSQVSDRYSVSLVLVEFSMEIMGVLKTV